MLSKEYRANLRAVCGKLGYRADDDVYKLLDTADELQAEIDRLNAREAQMRAIIELADSFIGDQCGGSYARIKEHGSIKRHIELLSTEPTDDAVRQLKIGRELEELLRHHTLSYMGCNAIECLIIGERGSGFVIRGTTLQEALSSSAQEESNE